MLVQLQLLAVSLVKSVPKSNVYIQSPLEVCIAANTAPVVLPDQHVGVCTLYMQHTPLL